MEGCSVGSRPSLVVQQCWAGSVKIREQTFCPGPSGSLMSVPCDAPRASLAALASNRHTTKWQGQKGCRWVSYPKSDWLSNGKKASNIKKLLVPSPHMQKASAWTSLCPDHSPDISGQELSIFTSTFFQKPPLIHKHQNVIFCQMFSRFSFQILQNWFQCSIFPLQHIISDPGGGSILAIFNNQTKPFLKIDIVPKRERHKNGENQQISSE